MTYSPIYSFYNSYSCSTRHVISQHSHYCCRVMGKLLLWLPIAPWLIIFACLYTFWLQDNVLTRVRHLWKAPYWLLVTVVTLSYLKCRTSKTILWGCEDGHRVSHESCSESVSGPDYNHHHSTTRLVSGSYFKHTKTGIGQWTVPPWTLVFTADRW